MKDLRIEQYCKQGGICPILKQEIPYDQAVFDHLHKTKAEEVGIDGKGLLRGVVHNQANVIEGKIARLYKRYGLNKFISLPELLRNIANYIENPPMKPEYIHPNERIFKKLAKRDYNIIKKFYFRIYPKRKKIPEYPKSGKMNRQFEKLLMEIEVIRKQK